MKNPQWSTAERRRRLVNLWSKYANRCLAGHPVCPVEGHYLKVVSKNITIAVPREIPYFVHKQTQPDCLACKKVGIHKVMVDDIKRVASPLYDLRHLYDDVTESIIAEWKAEDTERRNFEWKLEQRTITGEKGRWKRRFDPVARDVFMANQPEYYLVGLGIDALNFKRVALVRIPSTSTHLFVDVSRVGTFRRLSKNQRRKIVRYGGSPPADLMGEIKSLCQEAVMDWWKVKAKAPPALMMEG